MDRAGHQLLAGAALAGDHDRALVGADRLNHRVDVLHRRALADQLAKLLVRPDLAPQLADLLLQASGFEQLLDLDEQRVRVTRFGQIVGRPALHGLDRALNSPVSGQNNDGTAPLFNIHAAQQLHAVHDRHFQIGDDNVERAGVELTQRLPAVARSADHIAPALQNPGLGFGHVDFVFNQQNSGRHGDPGPYVPAMSQPQG